MCGFCSTEEHEQFHPVPSKQPPTPQEHRVTCPVVATAKASPSLSASGRGRKCAITITSKAILQNSLQNQAHAHRKQTTKLIKC